VVPRFSSIAQLLIRDHFVLFSTGVAVGCSGRHNQTRAVSPPAIAEEIHVPGVSDFGKVNDFLYRGAHPKDNGVEQLKKFGIDTIVDLCAASSMD
jgi:hypothetical protein